MMDSIVVYVQENNTSYRVNLPTVAPQEICRLCLNLTSLLQPIGDSPHAKDFDNFSFIGLRLGYILPQNVCKSCLTNFDQLGALLKKWQGSLYTYKKMEDNCTKVYREMNPSTKAPIKMAHVVPNSEIICGTNEIVSKPEDEEGEEEEEEEEEETCEIIEIVTKPDEETDFEERSSALDESRETIHSEIDLGDETEDILHIKTDVSDDSDEVLRIETELADDPENGTTDVDSVENDMKCFTQNTIKQEPTEPQLTSDTVDSETNQENADNTKGKSKTDSKSVKKICHKCGACVTSLTDHYKNSYQCQSRNYKCPMCNVYVNNAVKLRDHQRAYHWDQISATRLTCHICGKTFKYGCSLRRHLVVHEHGKQFMCEFCGKGYTRATDLRNHKNTHLSVKPYLCSQCGKGFTSKANLHSHMSRHTNPKKIYVARRQTAPKKTAQLDLVCTICERHFSRKDFLVKHMISHGEDTRPRDCRKCQITFETFEKYREHAEMHKKREHFCSYCTKSFCSAVVLQQHTLTHTGERPFLCALCGSKFRAPAHLKRHSMLIHNINRGKPFKCKYCEKTFALKENLLPHERIHTGERPYGCHVCDKNFIDPSRRKKHVRRYHGEQEVNKIPCGVNK